MRHTQSIRSRIVGVNVPGAERVLTALAGAALVGAGLSRRSLGGLLTAGLGAVALVRAATGRCPVYRSRAIRKGIHVRRVITIQATPREIYDLWRDLTNLPRFMDHVESVVIEDGGLSRWTIKEGAKRLHYRARITEDSPGQRLRWESLPGGDIEHVGAIELRRAPGDRGTELEVKLHYFPPGGIVVASALYALLRRLARTQIGMELTRLRQLIETGEIATGARRVEDLERKEKGVLEGRELQPQPAAPFSTAERSQWPTTGGVR